MEHCINDYLKQDELLQIFHLLPMNEWAKVLLVCRQWCSISLICFKPKILSILSHEWTGHTKWETRQGQTVEYAPQTVTTNMAFDGKTNSVSGTALVNFHSSDTPQEPG
jgi:hypothetical protein